MVLRLPNSNADLAPRKLQSRPQLGYRQVENKVWFPQTFNVSHDVPVRQE